MIRIKVSELLGKRKMTRNKLAVISKVRSNTIADLYYETAKTLKIDTLNKLCKALNCRIEELIEYVPDEEEEKGE